MGKKMGKLALSFLVYGALPMVLLVMLWRFPDEHLFSNAGIVALWIFIFLLFLKPAAIISRDTRLIRLLGYRRFMGVAVFWLAIFHGIGYINIYELSLLVALFLDISSHYFFGAVGLICVIILGITSNTISVRLLKRTWVYVHWLAYPLLFLVLFHAALASDKMTQFLVVSICYGIAKYAEYETTRRRKLPKK
jgi:DMSO/TMAO reductase YedYZ heme-binding membrane subunit